MGINHSSHLVVDKGTISIVDRPANKGENVKTIIQRKNMYKSREVGRVLAVSARTR